MREEKSTYCAWETDAEDRSQHLYLYGAGDYLCVVDKTAGCAVAHMKSIVCEQDIPEEVLSDNMPFNRTEFKRLATKYKFTSTSSPTYTQSNGRAHQRNSKANLS